jgi:hypothetical protein
VLAAIEPLSVRARGDARHEPRNRTSVTGNHDLAVAPQGLLRLWPVKPHIAHRHPSHGRAGVTRFTAGVSPGISVSGTVVIRSTTMRNSWLLMLAWLGGSCGSAGIGFDDIDGNKKVGDLSGAEIDAACAWTSDLAKARLPPSGTVVACPGEQIPFAWTTSCALGVRPTGMACMATVAQIRACLPAFLDEVKANPCPFLQASSAAAVNEIIAKISQCNGVDSCAYSP